MPSDWFAMVSDRVGDKLRVSTVDHGQVLVLETEERALELDRIQAEELRKLVDRYLAGAKP